MSVERLDDLEDLRYVRDFADLFDHVGPAEFRARVHVPVLVGVGLYGAIEDVKGRRTHGVDQNSDILAIQSLLDRVWLIEKRPSDQGRWITVGQDHNNAIVIAEYTLSSRHCAFAREGRSVLFADLGSLNGTKIDGRLAPPRKSIELVSGRKLTMGRLEAVYLSPQGFFRHIRDKSRSGTREARERMAEAVRAPQHSRPRDMPDRGRGGHTRRPR